jgi:ribA/ribD-fused uncharacterized protein
MNPDVIPVDSFTGRYRCFSNYWTHAVMMDGLEYPSNEHAFQAAKTLDPKQRESFLGLTAAQSKAQGQAVTLRPDWEDVKVQVMRDLLRQKFDADKHPDLVALLVGTNPRPLIEGNSWHDVFWGVCSCGGHRFCAKHKAGGKNNLGILLMEIRAEFVAKIKGAT